MLSTTTQPEINKIKNKNISIIIIIIIVLYYRLAENINRTCPIHSNYIAYKSTATV